MSTFFGLTMLGDEHMLGTRVKRRSEASASISQGRDLAHVGVEEFLRAFQRLARSSSNPDPNPNPNSGPPTTSQIRRALLPSLISDVLGRPPTVAEMDLFLRFFDVGPGNITIKEFNEGLHRLQSFSTRLDAKSGHVPNMSGQQSRQLRMSNKELHEDRGKHIVNEAGPADEQDMPVTCNQEYGWDDQFKIDLGNKQYYPRMKTDVTYNEGICLETYYKKF